MTDKARALKAAGRNVIGLGAGEPDFDTPANIKLAAIHAIEAGKTKYTAVDGIPELKEAIIAKFKRENGLTYQPNQVIVGTGRQAGALQRADGHHQSGRRGHHSRALLGELSGNGGARRRRAGAGGVHGGAGLQAAAEALEKAITPKTKWIILCSPSNPTGAAYSRSELKAITDVLVKHPDVWVMSRRYVRASGL